METLNGFLGKVKVESFLILLTISFACYGIASGQSVPQELIIPDGLYDIPEPTDQTFSGGVVYIDPSQVVNGDGSFNNPYNSWSSVTFRSNTAYLQKRGTAATSGSGGNVNSGNILIGAYGEGEKPVINFSSGRRWQFMGSGTTVRDIEFNGRIEFGAYSTQVNNSIVYNSDINCRGDQLVSWGGNILIAGCKIYNAGTDGIYIQDRTGNFNSCEISYTHIYDINSTWDPGDSESAAPGDVIQLDGCFNVHIHNNILDHSTSGNKFVIIIQDKDHYFTGNKMNVLVEDNILYPPKNSVNPSNGIYLQHDMNAVVRRNQIFGEAAISNGAGVVVVSTALENVSVYGNLIVNMAEGTHAYSSAVIDSCYNNTFVNVPKTKTGTWSLIKNNIFSQNDVDDADVTNISIDVEGIYNLFNDPANGNYTLKKGCVAIDAGEDMGLSEDINGTPIPFNGKPDIGAFEYADTCIGCSVKDFMDLVAVFGKNFDCHEDLNDDGIADAQDFNLPTGSYGKICD